MIYKDLIFPFDHIIIFICLLLIIFSFWKGFIQSLLGFLTWIGSIILTIYSYPNLSKFISDQLLLIDIFKNYQSIMGTIVSIPLIFLLSLFILKKIRKFLSSDLDKEILGLILDKLFGLIFGIILSYLIFSSIIFLIKEINIFSSFYNWVLENSYILNIINNINENIYHYLIINYFI